MLLILGLNERRQDEGLLGDRQQVCLLVQQGREVIVVLDPEPTKTDTLTPESTSDQ